MILWDIQMEQLTEKKYKQKELNNHQITFRKIIVDHNLASDQALVISAVAQVFLCLQES